MREVVLKFNLYYIDELDWRVKSRARNEAREVLADSLKDEFDDYCEDVLSEKFPNSTLVTQYSLSYTQGDGVNIYGKLYFEDLFKYFVGKFTLDEINYLKWAFDKTGVNYTEIPYNRDGFYCLTPYHDFFDEVCDRLEENEIKREIFLKAKLESSYIIEELCDILEEKGYDILYPDDECIDDICIANEYEFKINGQIYTY